MAEDRTLAIAIEAKLNRLDKNMSDAVKKIKAGTEKMEAAAATSAAKMEKSWASSFGRMGKAALGLAAAYGGMSAATGIFQKAVDAAKRFDELGDTAARLGTSAGELVKWQAALETTAGSMDGFNAAVETFQGKIGAFIGGIGKTKAIADALGQIGISREQIGSLATMEERLLLIADGLGKIEDRAIRAAIADKLGIRELLPLLDEGADGIKRLTAQFDGLGEAADEGVKRTGAMADQIRLLQAELQMKEDNLFVRITPFVVEFYQWLSAVLDLIGENRGLFEMFFGSGVTSGFYAPLNMAENALTPARELLVLQRELRKAYSELTIAEESNGKISVGDIQATINELEARVASLKGAIGLSGGAGTLAGRGVKPRAAPLVPPEIDDGSGAAGIKAAEKEAEALAKASAKASENMRELGKDMLAAFGEDARDELVRTTQAVEDAAQAAADFKDSFKSDFVQSFKYALTTGDLAGAAANFGMSIADRMLERLAEQAFDVLWESGFGEGMNALFGDADLAQAALASSASAASASVTTMTAAANAAATALMRLAMTPVQSGSSGGLGGILAQGIGALFGMGGAVSGGAGGLAANGIGLLGRRALGGPVTAGTPYMVGERGPEPFVPAVNGRILSVQQAQQAIRGGGGGPVFAPVINMPGADSAAVSRMASELDAQRRQFQSWAASEGARIRGHVNQGIERRSIGRGV